MPRPGKRSHESLVQPWDRVLGRSQGSHLTISLSFLKFLLSFYFFRAAPAPYGGSQARGPVGAAAVGLHHSHSSNAGSQPSLQSMSQLMAMPDPQPTDRGQGLNLRLQRC